VGLTARARRLELIKAAFAPTATDFDKQRAREFREEVQRSQSAFTKSIDQWRCGCWALRFLAR
jgi:hypothetical protein